MKKLVTTAIPPILGIGDSWTFLDWSVKSDPILSFLFKKINSNVMNIDKNSVMNQPFA